MAAKAHFAVLESGEFVRAIGAMAESAPMTRILGTEDVGRWRLFRLPLAQEHPEGVLRC